jgi:threonine/homoserine/homoserine lactone efflux protein
VTLALTAKLEEVRPLLGIFSIDVGSFVFLLAWENFRPACQEAQAPAELSRSWSKGIVVNLLIPHPWIFWLTVGASERWLVRVQQKSRS